MQKYNDKAIIHNKIWKCNHNCNDGIKKRAQLVCELRFANSNKRRNFLIGLKCDNLRKRLNAF